MAVTVKRTQSRRASRSPPLSVCTTTRFATPGRRATRLRRSIRSRRRPHDREVAGHVDPQASDLSAAQASGKRIVVGGGQGEGAADPCRRRERRCGDRPQRALGAPMERGRQREAWRRQRRGRRRIMPPSAPASRSVRRRRRERRVGGGIAGPSRKATTSASWSCVPGRVAEPVDAPPSAAAPCGTVGWWSSR